VASKRGTTLAAEGEDVGLGPRGVDPGGLRLGTIGGRCGIVVEGRA
jgi:hypothetical protein